MKCLVLEMREDGRLPALGKHEAHPPHDWWYTSYGGGHQLYKNWKPDGKTYFDGWAYDSLEGYVQRRHCDGRD